MNDPMQFDKIWIEIEPVEDRSEASQKIAQARCDKVNIALELLGIDEVEFTVNPNFFDGEGNTFTRQWGYHLTKKRSGEYYTLHDNGYHFNLDYITKTGFWEQKKAG